MAPLLPSCLCLSVINFASTHVINPMTYYYYCLRSQLPLKQLRKGHAVPPASRACALLAVPSLRLPSAEGEGARWQLSSGRPVGCGFLQDCFYPAVIKVFHYDRNERILSTLQRSAYHHVLGKCVTS
jgi:hypothetical protein